LRAFYLLLLAALLFLPSGVAAQEVGAKVYLEEPSFDFGWIPQQAVVTHSFYLHSKGTDSLRILRVKPG
jgi:hypothetical protein